MREERIELSQRERERLKVLPAVKRGHVRQREAAGRLQLSPRQGRRLLRRVKREGDGGLIHRGRGRRSNRKIAARQQRRILAEVRRRYGDFGPTLAAEQLAQQGLRVSRETLRQWMIAAGLWRQRRARVERMHTWRARRAQCGELVPWNASEHDWLEGRGEKLYLILMIDDATSRALARFVRHTIRRQRTCGRWGGIWSAGGAPWPGTPTKPVCFESTGRRGGRKNCKGSRLARSSAARSKNSASSGLRRTRRRPKGG